MKDCENKDKDSLSSFKVWFIGDSVGVNGGYAALTNNIDCPEQSTAVWEYW